MGNVGLDRPTTEMMTARLALFGYLGEFIEEKRTNPGDDLLSQIMAIDGDEAWTKDEILGMCFLFTLAGLIRSPRRSVSRSTTSPVIPACVSVCSMIRR